MRRVVVAIALLFWPAVARADVACCDGWESMQYVSCITQSGASCQGPRSTIAIETTDGGDPSCTPGQTPCLIIPEFTCCLRDCLGGTQCALTAPAPLPSCCAGYCGENSGSQPTPACATFPAQVNACCDDASIEAPPSVLSEPSEWTVSYGYPLPTLVDAGGGAQDAAPPPAASPPSKIAGGCSVGRGGPPRSCAALAQLGLCAAARGRRRRRPIA